MVLSQHIKSHQQSFVHKRLLSADFVPSAILTGNHLILTPDIARKACEVGFPFNPNYKGEITGFDLRNAKCSEEENCAIRIQKIDPKASLLEIFDIITHEKVLSFHLNPAVEGVYSHTAARLVFLTRAAAESFIGDTDSNEGLQIRKQRIDALWNREKVCPAETHYQKKSRAIRVKGPVDKLSVKMLDKFFKSKFAFQLVASKEWIERDGYKVVEMSFSSIRAPSKSAVKCFREFFGKIESEEWKAWYSRDLCSPVETSAYPQRNLRSLENWR
ncbi:Nucleotide-binding alpha-beta plait protein [Rutstroemia sp. NJR-2017a BBW]|nr:Nucleotide-binding alpha-beta plait protein [Rutstroemia sp. NJR-2017a BBW]